MTSQRMMVSGGEDHSSLSGHQGEPPDRTDPALLASSWPVCFAVPGGLRHSPCPSGSRNLPPWPSERGHLRLMSSLRPYRRLMDLCTPPPHTSLAGTWQGNSTWDPSPQSSFHEGRFLLLSPALQIARPAQLRSCDHWSPSHRTGSPLTWVPSFSDTPASGGGARGVDGLELARHT